MIDPISNMEVKESMAAGRSEYGGKTYLFCNLHCLEKFKEDPAKYLAPAKQPAADQVTTPRGATYVCPMDPEVHPNLAHVQNAAWRLSRKPQPRLR